MEKNMDQETLRKLHKQLLELLDEFVRICDKNNLDYFLCGGTLLGAVRHKGFIPWDDDMDVAMLRKDYEKFLKIAPVELKEKFIIDNYHTNKKCYLNFTKIRNRNTLFVQDFQKDYDGEKGIWIDIFPLDYIEKLNFFQVTKIKIVKLIRSIEHYKNNIFLGNNKIWLKKILTFLMKPIPLTFLQRLQDNLMKGKTHDKEAKYITSIASTYDYKKETMEKDVYLPAKTLEFEGKEYKVPNQYKYYLEKIYGNYMELPAVEKRVTHCPIKIKFEDSK